MTCFYLLLKFSWKQKLTLFYWVTDFDTSLAPVIVDDGNRAVIKSLDGSHNNFKSGRVIVEFGNRWSNV